MGMPEIKIMFREITKKAIEYAGRGIALIIIKDSKNKGITAIYEDEDIPSTFTGNSLKAIEMVREGNLQWERVGEHLELVRFKPTKVLVYGMDTAEELDTALKACETEEFNIVAYCNAENDTDNQKVIDFIKKLKKNGFESTALISSQTLKPDSEDVVNFAEEEFKVNGSTMTGQNYLPRIAGLIVGTPYSQAITYATLSGITEIPERTREEEDKLVDAGKLILTRKNKEYRIGRGVNTRTTIDENRGKKFRKIKLVNIFKFINNSIYKVILEQYLGKVGNTYDNKCLLIADIRQFLSDLKDEGLLEADYVVDIHMKKQKAYLKSKGVDVRKMNDAQIREANTDDKVFLLITLTAVDAMEDFEIEILV